MKKHIILKLDAEGKSFMQIHKETGFSKSTISYHLSDGQKEKTKERLQNMRNTPLGKLRHKLGAKADKFNFSTISQKRKQFSGIYIKGSLRTKDIYRKLEEQNYKCYLTGEDLKLEDTSSWHLDHIIPLCQGGDSSYENLGICTREANLAKNGLTINEFLVLCKKVLKYNKH